MASSRGKHLAIVWLASTSQLAELRKNIAEIQKNVAIYNTRMSIHERGNRNEIAHKFKRL